MTIWRGISFLACKVHFTMSSLERGHVSAPRRPISIIHCSHCWRIRCLNGLFTPNVNRLTQTCATTKYVLNLHTKRGNLFHNRCHHMGSVRIQEQYWNRPFGGGCYMWLQDLLNPRQQNPLIHPGVSLTCIDHASGECRELCAGNPSLWWTLEN